MPTPTWPPGISRESVRAPSPVRFRTGVPVFVGYTERVTPTRAAPGTAEAEAPEMRGWADFQDTFGAAVTPGPVADAGTGFLAPAVRGFFRNGGQVCRVVALARPDDAASHAARHVAALESVDRLEDVDLLCLPDLLLPLAELGLEAQRTGAEPDAGAVAAARGNAAALHGEVLRYCGRRGDL
ncbi:MAG TPA: hypothetical protein VFH27_02595, partial [Longimicrobiaceae bacterium]|nr:hypothetical protein [Longimicrobiaceae bacterium]